MDKSHNVISYSLPISFINYQMKILKGDVNEAKKVIRKFDALFYFIYFFYQYFFLLFLQIYENIPKEFTDRITKFLEKFEKYELCYEIVTNVNQK